MTLIQYEFHVAITRLFKTFYIIKITPYTSKIDMGISALNLSINNEMLTVFTNDPSPSALYRIILEHWMLKQGKGLSVF